MTVNDILTGHRVALILFTILVAILVQLAVRKSINDLVRRAVKRQRYASRVEEKKREETLVQFFRPASRIIIWTIALIVALSIAGVNWGALIAGAGVIGVVAGIGGQSALRDYVGGIYIILENQYRVGDVVRLADNTSGIVEDITIRITKLRDLDGNLHFVRNGESVIVTNMTSEWSRANVDLQVGWGANLDMVEQIINEVGAGMMHEKEWREVIIEPIQFFRVDGFTGSAINVKALGKTVPINQWAVAGEFRRRLKAEFDKHNIERPFPQRIIHQAKKQA